MVSGTVSVTDGEAHRSARRRANERKAAGSRPATDEQGLVAFSCECMAADCERSVSVPSTSTGGLPRPATSISSRLRTTRSRGHRTMVSEGLMRIEERA